MMAMALACGRAGTSQSSAPSEERPMTIVPSGAASAQLEAEVSHAAQKIRRILFIIEGMARVLSTHGRAAGGPAGEPVE